MGPDCPDSERDECATRPGQVFPTAAPSNQTSKESETAVRPPSLLGFAGFSSLALVILAVVGLQFAARPTPAVAETSVTPTALNWEYKGASILVGYKDELLGAAPTIRLLASDGANSVTFVYICYVANATDNAIDCDSSLTASDVSLRYAISVAKASGLKVGLKPHLDSLDGTWRAVFQPSNPDLFWQNYTTMMYRYADLGRDNGASLLIIGTEMISMSTSTAYESRWRTLISGLRQRWPQVKLTYSANWGRRYNEEFNKIKFWDALDYLGFSAYFELASWPTPTVQDLLYHNLNATSCDDVPCGWQRTYELKIAPFQADPRWAGKPILFTEVGYRSVDGSATHPWDTSKALTTVDNQEQRDAYEALFEFWSKRSGFAGVLFYYAAVNTSSPFFDIDYPFQTKPAEQVVSQWFKAMYSNKYWLPIVMR